MRFYVTTPIYYVNDRPHLGHAYTTIAADVLARWHRLRGDDVFFLTGTDEHGAKVAASAESQGKTLKDFCDANSEEFRKMFERLDISFDDFIRTTEERHIRAVRTFLQKLWDKGEIYEGKYEGFYCTGCENFIGENELVDGKCPQHLKIPEQISEKNYFFRFQKYLSQVQKLIENDEISIEPEERKNEALGLLRHGLADFSISREKIKWGIPLPFDSSQVAYVWIEALQNYISAIGYGEDEERFRTWWTESGPLHLMAKDIVKFHAIYWPALLLAAGEKPPKRLFVHGFFTINGQKMSKTLGNVMNPRTLVDQFGVDATRYLLLSPFPFGQDGDIEEGRFLERYTADLANQLGNLVYRILTIAEKYFDSKVPDIAIEKTGKSRNFSYRNQERNFEALSSFLARLWGKIENAYDTISLDRILSLVFGGTGLVTTLNRLIDYSELWTFVKQNRAEGSILVYDILESLRHTAWIIAPFMPQTSRLILEQLGMIEEYEGVEKSKISLKEIRQWGRLIPSVKIHKGSPLFRRLNT